MLKFCLQLFANLPRPLMIWLNLVMRWVAISNPTNMSADLRFFTSLLIYYVRVSFPFYS